MNNKSYLQLERKYKNRVDGTNIGKELIAPCLAGEPSLYRRGTAYFSSTSLKSYASVIERLLDKKVKFEILCSPVIQDKALLEILKNNSNEIKREEAFRQLSETIVLDAVGFSQNPTSVSHRTKVLSYMIASGQLEIRFAIPRNMEKAETGFNNDDLYHVKNGYFTFKDGNDVAFDGSFNESENGHVKNYEKTQVFRSYENSDIERLQDTIEDIDDDWNGRTQALKIHPLSDDILKKIKLIASKLPPGFQPDPPKPKPPQKKLPTPWDHQLEALDNWKNNNYKGILALATGSGKTITAIHATHKMSQQLISGDKKSLCVLISVPYVVLADQWVSELGKYNINPIKCYGSSRNWHTKLSSKVFSFNLHSEEFLVMVVVNATLRATKFQNLLHKIKINDSKKMLVITDECHHHANKQLVETKLPKAQYIMGLSATPWNKNDSDSERILTSYYGKIVAKYDLDDALRDGVLCPYYYHIHEVAMNNEEEEVYLKLTSTITSLYQQLENSGLGPEEKKILEFTIYKRARHLDAIEDKFEVLRNILSTKEPEPFKLFYCGSGFQSDDNDEEGQQSETERLRNIDRITKILKPKGWKVAQFTSEESQSTRLDTLELFKNRHIHAIAAIKVLDEGFDIPKCNEAYITASSSSERQWVQRRGRILRIAKHKDSATVHDFVITQTSDTELFQPLITKELERVEAFQKSCSNKLQNETQIAKIKQKYHLI